MIEINVDIPKREIIENTVTINARPIISGVTASIDNNVGEPYVDVASTGTYYNYSFDLQFHNLKGDHGATGATGETGNGIVNTEYISSAGLVDTYHVNYTNGNYDSFTVTNGQNGTGSVADVLVNGTSVLDGQDAKILIKTINSNSIVGSGNIDIDTLPAQSGQSGKYLTTNGTNASWADVDSLPSQTGQSGKFLTTDGTDASWANVDALPSQTGHSGEYLTTDGTDASWSAISGANTDLSNLTSTGKKVIDGQWVDSYLQLAGAVTYPKATDLDYSLTNYLPDDNYNYEVIVMGYVNTGSTTGSNCSPRLKSDLITNGIYLSATRTRTNSTMLGGGSLILPVGSARKITVVASSAASGDFSIWVAGYRRIGTNS